MDYKTNCAFEFFKQVTLTQINTNIYVDHYNKVLLEIPDNPTTVTCQNPQRIITKSQNNVWFATRPQTANIVSSQHQNIHKKQIMGNYNVRKLYKPIRFVSFHSVFQVSYNYLLYMMQYKIKLNHKDIQQSYCSLSNHQPGHLIHVKDNEFFKNHGDVISIIKCRTQKVVLKNNSTFCYKHFKLQDGRFLDPNNHLIVSSSSRRECNPKFLENIIRDLNTEYFSQEPQISSVNVLSNITLYPDFSFNFNSTKIDLLENDQGLLDSTE